MHGLLIAVVSLAVELGLAGSQAPAVAAHGLSSWGSQALEHRLSSCGPQAWLLHGVWDLSRPGIKPICLALADGFFFSFFATEPPEKPCTMGFYSA